MKTIYLVRHGDYENPQKILPCRLPGFPLSEIGREQIRKDALYLTGKHITGIYASPILRTKQSARITGQILGLPVIFSKSLVEVRSPVQGQPISITPDIERYGDSFRYPLHVRGNGETIGHIYARMKRIVRKALGRQKGNIVLVGHGDPLMIYFLMEQGKSLVERPILSYGTYIPKGGMIRMDYKNGKLDRVRSVNYS